MNESLAEKNINWGVTPGVAMVDGNSIIYYTFCCILKNIFFLYYDIIIVYILIEIHVCYIKLSGYNRMKSCKYLK